MTQAKPRIFIVDFDLVSYSGHSFNQVLGFREAARVRQLEARIYIRSSASPTVTAQLNGHAILPPVPWPVSDGGVLEAFANVRSEFHALWNALESAEISRSDILVITSSQPQVIYGVSQWLGGLPDPLRPAVFFRFFRTDFYSFRTKSFSRTSWAYYFCARILETMPGGDRVFLTVNNRAAVRYLDQLTRRSNFFLPVPKYYGPLADSPKIRSSEFVTIYVHVNRQDHMPALVSHVVGEILRQRSDVKFVVRICGYVFPTEIEQDRAIRQFSGQDVTFVPGDQDAAGYLAAIEQADMILLPYDPEEYLDIVSGIFCEAAALGKVVIVPAGTWMASHVTEGRASGVMFCNNTAEDIAAAVERALEDRVSLQTMASRGARSFRDENSCEGNLAGMIELAAQSHDMRLSYVPLTDATKTLVSQRYLGNGWSATDEGFGTWSDAEFAEINFLIKPSALDLVFNVEVLPFLTPEHSRLDVSVAANDVPLAEWSFEVTDEGRGAWSWRHAQIPADIAASGDIRIAFQIRLPASPKDLGVSAERRKLGIAIRQFSLGPDAPITNPEKPLPERRSFWQRLRRLLQG